MIRDVAAVGVKEQLRWLSITVTANRAAVLLFSCLQCYQRATANYAVLQQWPGGVISRRSWTSGTHISGLVASGELRSFWTTLWSGGCWMLFNTFQLSEPHFASLLRYIKWLSVIADSSCVGTSVPTMLPQMVSLLKDDAVCIVGSYWGREAKKKLSESNSFLILVHFQGNT